MSRGGGNGEGKKKVYRRKVHAYREGGRVREGMQKGEVGRLRVTGKERGEL